MKCGETQKQIGGAEREFIQGAAFNFLTPFRNFLEGDFKTILVNAAAVTGPVGEALVWRTRSSSCEQKERKLLQVKRLDLDAAKTRLKKARMADARAAVSRPNLRASLPVLRGVRPGSLISEVT